MPRVSSTIRSTEVPTSGGKGFGGGEATRDPEPTFIDPNDPKGKQQAIHKAESYVEYLAKRNGQAAAPATAPPAALPPRKIAVHYTLISGNDVLVLPITTSSTSGNSFTYIRHSETFKN